MTSWILGQVARPARAFLGRHKRLAARVEALMHRVPRLQDIVFRLVESDPKTSYATWVATYDTIDEPDLAVIRHQSVLAQMPRLSLLAPIAGASVGGLEALVTSLVEQVYEHWELSFVGELPDDSSVLEFIRRAPARDARIRPFQASAGSWQAWNEGIASAHNEIVVLSDPSTTIRPHALFLIASAVTSQPEVVLIYADEDLIDDEGTRSGHYFKPDWNETLLRSQNYLGRLVGFRRDRALATGGCRNEPDGELLWGLFLRMTAGVGKEEICHLPFVLSHRRVAPTELGRPDAVDNQLRAHEKRLADLGCPAKLTAVGRESFRTRYALPKAPPTVSVIIPTIGDCRLLRPCLDSLLGRTLYAPFEVVLVVGDIRSKRREQRAFLESAARLPRVRLLSYGDRAFNFSWVNNWAVANVTSPLVCFLNDDTEVIANDWLSAMVAHVLHDGVAAVGAKLYFRNGRIQHAGVILGVGGLAGHSYRGRPKHWRGYHDRALIDQDVSCVTAACMLVRRDAFLEVGRFDETLATAFNDVDLCLRLREAGWRIVWTPSAELYHDESVSFGAHDAGPREHQWRADWRLMHSRWSTKLVSDPHYSPNLSLDGLEVWELAFPPRVSYPWTAAEQGREGDRPFGEVSSAAPGSW